MPTLSKATFDGSLDRFLAMSGLGDNNVRYAPGRNQPGKCTRWNWLALGAFQNTTTLYSATDAWNATPAQHRHPIVGNTVVPKNAIIVLGPTGGPRWAGDRNWRYGDFIMAHGVGEGLNNRVRATDSLRGTGIIGDMLLGDRCRQTGRNVLGWISSVGGWVLPVGSSSPGVTPPKKEEKMAEVQPIVYTDGTRFVGGDEVAGLFTFGSLKELQDWETNKPIARRVNAKTLSKLATKANK